MAAPKPWVYEAKLHHFYDGDTVHLWIDQGFGTWRLDKFRLYGVDTPEIRGVTDEEKRYGQEARIFAVDLAMSEPFLAESRKKGRAKYDYTVDIHLLTTGGTLSDRLILFGHAVPYFGKKKQPWPERKRIQDLARAAVALTTL